MFMAGFADKSITQLEQEIHQLEETASRQQSSATSYERALRQSQARLAETERNQTLQQAHLRQLQSDAKSKSDSARNARQAAAWRREEVRRRIQEAEEESTQRAAQRRTFLQLHEFEIKALVERARQDPTVRDAFRSLKAGHWGNEELQRCQSTIWEVLSGACSKEMVAIATTVVDAWEVEEDDVVVVLVKSGDQGVVESPTFKVRAQGKLTPVSKLGKEAIPEGAQVNIERQQAAGTDSYLTSSQPTTMGERNRETSEQRHTSSPHSVSRIALSPAITLASLHWNVQPPRSTLKRPRIESGGDFFT